MHRPQGAPDADGLTVGPAPDRRFCAACRCVAQSLGHCGGPGSFLPALPCRGVDHRHDTGLQRIRQARPCVDNLGKIGGDFRAVSAKGAASAIGGIAASLVITWGLRIFGIGSVDRCSIQLSYSRVLRFGPDNSSFPAYCKGFIAVGNGLWFRNSNKTRDTHGKTATPRLIRSSWSKRGTSRPNSGVCRIILYCNDLRDLSLDNKPRRGKLQALAPVVTGERSLGKFRSTVEKRLKKSCVGPVG